MRGKMLLASMVIALIAFSGILLAMTSEEISKLPSEERAMYEEKIEIGERVNIPEAYRVSTSSDRLMISRDGEYVAPEIVRKQIIGTRSEAEKAVIIEEGFETSWPPAGWTVIQTNTDVSGPTPGYWTRTDGTAGSIGVHSGAYNSGLWWSYSHQDEWLITDDFTLTGSASGTYYVTFWTYGYEGSTYADHYYVKVSTDEGDTWTELFDMSAQPGNAWNYWAYPYDIDLSDYAGETVRLAWHAVDGPTNDGLWYVWFIDDITVWYPLDHDVGVTEIYAPVGSYLPDVYVTPRVEVENFGANNETFDVTFKIYNGTRDVVYSETVPEVTVNSGATQSVSFPAWDTFLGSYTTEAYTELATDEEPANDTLTGDFEVSIVVPEDTLHYDGPNDDNGVGLTSGGTFEGAIRLTPTELAGYDGWQLSSVTFFHYGAATHSGNIKIYEGGTPTNPGALIIQEPYTAVGQGWNRIDLSTPVMLDTGNDLWVSVEITHAAGEYPIGVDAGPAVVGKGDWVAMAGDWSELIDYDLNYNWNIRAIVEIGIQLDHDVAAQSIIQPTGTYSSGIDVAPKTRIKNIGTNTETFDTYFKIYDGTKDEVYSEVVNTTLAPGVTDTLTFPDFTTYEGAFEAVSYTDLDVDENPGNDTTTGDFSVVGWAEDFETTDGGFVPTPETGGWEWGVPTSGPGAAHSGTKVWATNLEGEYINSANWKLEREFVATSDNPELSFYHWYNIESYYDGGNVKISTNGGASWQIIYPATGYPEDAAYSGNAGIPNEPCYSGAGTSWQIATFDLTGYVDFGDPFLIRWHFGSDPSVTYDGWYIDDVMGQGLEPYVPEHDIEVYSITSPAPGVSSGDVVVPSVVVINRGNAEETFPLSFEITEDETSIYYEVVSPTVDPGEVYTVRFPGWTAVEGSYTATTIATCPGDVNPGNDTLIMGFTVYGWYEGFDVTNGGFEAYNESGSIGWQWGAPTSGPGAAHSGEYLWATVLAGDYETYSDYSLVRKFYAMTGNPVLSFWFWYNTEANYDGGNVKISLDQENWTVVSPTRGYDGVANTANPLYPESIFSGHNQGYWELVDFDLADYVSEGEFFYIRWHFGSDGSVQYPGLYVDDVSGTGLTGYMPYDTWVNRICAEPGFDEILPGHAVHLCAEVENNPIGPVANFRVYMKIMDSEGNLVYSSSEDVRDLEPRGVRVVWFATDWVPAAETYTLRVFIQNAFEPPTLQDNNVMEMEVTVGGDKMAVADVPDVYFLSQSHPNPVKDAAQIAYGLPEASRVDLRIYDITGRIVKTLVNGDEAAGYKSVDWNLTDDSGMRVARGIYFYKLVARDFNATKKLIVIE